MSEEMSYTMTKDAISTNNAIMLTDVSNKINEIILLLYNYKPIDAIVAQLKNIIRIVNDNGQKLNILLNNMMNIAPKINNIDYNVKNIDDNFKKLTDSINSNPQRIKAKKIYNNSPDPRENGEYDGELVNGLRDGVGTFKRMDGGKYQGEYKNDAREGRGVMFHADGGKYVGDYKNDRPNGKGIAYFFNGDRYDGDFKNGEFEGKGVYYCANGDRYEGDFKNSTKDGNGIVYYSNGDREMMDWKNDKPVGLSVRLSVYGKISQNYY